MHVCRTCLPIVALSTISAAGPLPHSSSEPSENISTTITTGLPAGHSIQGMNADRRHSLIEREWSLVDLKEWRELVVRDTGSFG